MACSREKPKLSLLAQFDDHTRMLQSFAHALDDNFDGPLALLQQYDENRKRWIHAIREAKKKDTEIGKLTEENQALKMRLESIRMAYAREMKSKEQLQQDYNELSKKLYTIRDLLTEESIRRADSQNSAVVLSVLNDIKHKFSAKIGGAAAEMRQYRAVDDLNESDLSDDGLLFDKSDDTLESLHRDDDYDDDDDAHQTRIKMARIEPTGENIYSQIDFGKKKLITQLNAGGGCSSVEKKKHPSTILEEDDEMNTVDVMNTGFSLEAHDADRNGANAAAAANKNNNNNNGHISISSSGVSSDAGTQGAIIAAAGPQSSPQPSYTSSESAQRQPGPGNLGQKSKSLVSSMRRRSGRLLSNFNLMRNASKLEIDRLDLRPHTFQQKKAFKPLSCVPCGKSIGFCSTCLICVDCRGVVHPRCESSLPKPCVPYVGNAAGIRKMTSSAGNHLVMIGDFTSPTARPCIPALLIHCCNEIDRRIECAIKRNGQEAEVGPTGSTSTTTSIVGLYRVCGSEKDIRELRTKILDGKNGIPNLAAIADPHVLCGVVKAFLRDLDDPLVTHVLCKDFIRAAEHVEESVSASTHHGDRESPATDSDYNSHEEHASSSPRDDRKDSIGGGGHDDDHDRSLNESLDILKAVIIQLPNPNRDSLAFLFAHFRRVIDAREVTRMEARSLASIFAPTIVGSSAQRVGSGLRYSTSLRQTPTNAAKRNAEAINENIKQISVMQALFRLPNHFWLGLLRDPNFCPFEKKSNRRSLNKSIIQKISSTNLNNLIGGKVTDALY